MYNIIDPTCFSPSEEQLLIALLQSKPESAVWQPGKYYSVKLAEPAQSEQVLLPFYIVKARSRKRGYKYHVVTSESIGSGSYGDVYPVIRSYWIEEIDGVLQLKYKEKPYGKRKVDKIVDTLKHDDSESLTINEYIQNKRTPSLSPKPLVRSGTEIHAIMNRKEGDELFEIISAERTPVRDPLTFEMRLPKPLTIKERFKLTINLLQALQEEVIDAGLLHRDIKLENIRADVKTGTVSFVDFNLSRIATDVMLPGSDGAGSYCYAAPEIFQNKGCSLQSDLLATGRVIALIWGDINPLMDSEGRIGREADIALAYARSNTFHNLFSQPEGAMSSLKPQARKIILETLMQMTAFNPRIRTDCQKALEQFKQAYAAQFRHEYGTDEKKSARRSLSIALSNIAEASDASKKAVNTKTTVKTALGKALNFFKPHKSQSEKQAAFAQKEAKRISA
ncbi:hypothetical protein ACFORL_04440 [Legionella dresdenensis]|uniref:Protein kinase domain-containing protein n=1 Tax=Legionella dresdenensis TaxID=450200 RepID=A0ABV8CDY5_9GAMM